MARILYTVKVKVTIHEVYTFSARDEAEAADFAQAKALEEYPECDPEDIEVRDTEPADTSEE